MAKRYHQSKRDRKDESRGMKRAEIGSHFNKGMYAGQGYMRPSSGTGDTTAYGEINPGTGSRAMIHTEPDKMSGLPQDVKMHSYPKTESFMPYGLSWGLEAEDRQIAGDQHQIKKQFAGRKA